MDITFHPSVVEKLRTKHNVDPIEVIQCFANVTRGFLVDDDEDHATDPPTHWFIEQTDMGRLLFVAFMYFEETRKAVIKTAYEPGKAKIDLYLKVTKK